MTAEEYLISKGLNGVGNLLVRSHSNYSENGTQKLMVEFAKYHVQKALKEASDKFDTECNKYVILNAYPLENIK